MIDDKAMPDFIWATACGHQIEFLLKPKHRALLTRNEHRFVHRCHNCIAGTRELCAEDRARLAYLVNSNGRRSDQAEANRPSSGRWFQLRRNPQPA
jgi:hypothetical protein